MPTNSSSRDSSLKDPELYAALRGDGASKEKAARISNAAAGEGRSAVGKRGGTSGAYEEWSVKDLRSRARGLGVSGYSRMRKSELIDAIRNH
jgi:hypothetical protein